MQDQEAAKSAFMTVAGSDHMPLLLPVLKEGNPAARKSCHRASCMEQGEQYFQEVLPYTSSTDLPVKSAAFKALENLAGPDDQDKLIELLSATEDQEFIADLQSALAAAASKVADPQKRSAILLQAMAGKSQKG